MSLFLEETVNQNKQLIIMKLMKIFIDQTKINICVTAPSSDLGDSVRLKESNNDFGKIVLSNQNDCVHQRLNFSNELAGTSAPLFPMLRTKSVKNSRPNITEKDRDCHCKNIKHKLEEVKESSKTGEDIYGLQNAFNLFLDYINDLIKESSLFSSFEKDSIEFDWACENFEKFISKKLNKALYKKNPSYQDLHFYYKTKVLDWIDLSHFEIGSIRNITEKGIELEEMIFLAANSKML